MSFCSPLWLMPPWRRSSRSSSSRSLANSDAVLNARATAPAALSAKPLRMLRDFDIAPPVYFCVYLQSGRSAIEGTRAVLRRPPPLDVSSTTSCAPQIEVGHELMSLGHQSRPRRP